MARMRTIKPEAFTSLSLSEVDRGIRWTFAGLWTHCDDEGRAEWVPRLLIAAIYPLDDTVTVDVITSDMKELERIGAVCFYTVGGKNYVHIPAWSDHQHPNRKVSSRLPTCPRTDHTMNAHAQRSEPAVSTHPQDTPVVVVVDVVGVVDVEGTQERVPAPRKRATRIPDDWKPTLNDIAWQRTKNIPDDVARREAEKFGNYWRARSSNATSLNWSLTWHNWLLKAIEQTPNPGAGRKPTVGGYATPGGSLRDAGPMLPDLDPLASAR